MSRKNHFPETRSEIAIPVTAISERLNVSVDMWTLRMKVEDILSIKVSK